MQLASTHDARRPDPFATLLTVDPAHNQIDLALLNWAAWLRGSGGSPQESPMFRLYRSSFARGGYGQLTRAAAVHSGLAVDVERIMRQLPERHRDVLVGWYVERAAPWNLARNVGITKDELAPTLHDARTMAKNRMRSTYGERWHALLPQE